MAHEYFLVLVTRIKQEGPYLREWLAYHQLVGVDHFFLYDMDDDDASRQLLRPYEERGVVTRTPWAHYEGTRLDGQSGRFLPSKSTLAHRHFVRHHRHRVQWAQMLDGDEFLYPMEGDSVREVFQGWDPRRVRAIRMPRINFGDCGHETRPPGLVIENYLRREASTSAQKEAGNADRLSPIPWNPGSHQWKYRLFAGGRVVLRDQVEGIRINHYFSKSFEEFTLRQNTNQTRRQNREQFEARNRTRNEVSDDGMLRFAPAVREALGDHTGP